MARGSGTITKRGKIWWVQVCVDGEVIRQSARSEKYSDAKHLRDKLLGQRARGELGGRNAKVTVDALLDNFLKALAVRVRPDTLKIQTLVVDANVRPFFGPMKADKITSDKLLEYREYREEQGAQPSTQNRELSLLRNAMRTGAHASPPLIPESVIPRFPITNEDACARQGFLTDDQFDPLISELPGYLIPITTVGYNTGIRRGELLKIEWDQVDFAANVIRLYRGQTKTGDPRTVPMIGNMREVLLMAKEDRDAHWPDCPWVFHRLGAPLKDFRGAWDSACDRAGLQGTQFHDLRRSGVRNLSRAGVPERVIMSITGHKTRAMFDRYNIVDESDLSDAAQKLEAFRASKNSPTGSRTDTKSDTAPKNTNGHRGSDGR